MEIIRRTRAEFEQLQARQRDAVRLCRAATALLDDSGQGDEDAKRAAQSYAVEAVRLQEEVNRSVVE